MGLFDPISKALKGEPVAPQPAAPASTGQGPSQADVDAQWRKDNGIADPAAGDLIDQLHPAGGK